MSHAPFRFMTLWRVYCNNLTSMEQSYVTQPSFIDWSRYLLHVIMDLMYSVQRLVHRQMLQKQLALAFFLLRMLPRTILNIDSITLRRNIPHSRWMLFVNNFSVFGIHSEVFDFLCYPVITGNTPLPDWKLWLYLWNDLRIIFCLVLELFSQSIDRLLPKWQPWHFCHSVIRKSLFKGHHLLRLRAILMDTGLAQLNASKCFL